MPKSLQNRIIEFLQKKGYRVQVEPVYPSTIDILASRGDSFILAEIKSADKIDSSDIIKLKSYENFLKNVIKPKKRFIKTFLISPGEATGSAKMLSKKLKINILKPYQLNKIFSPKVSKKKS